MEPLLEKVLRHRVVPVCTVQSAEEAVGVSRAVLAGGLDVIEFAFRTAASADAVRAVRTQIPEMEVGAGTLLTTAQVKEAHDAGASFGVSPGFNADVVKASHDLGMPLIPGVATPTEMEAAMAAGCTVLKLFPANVVGGPDFLKAVAGPYGHTGVKFIITGGVNAGTMGEYLALPITAAVFGSWMVNKELVGHERWDDVTDFTRGALGVVNQLGLDGP